jgi:hypothetical protein
MLNYHDVEKRLPPNQQTSPTRHNWAAYMLRFTEQEALFESYQWDIDWNDAGNQPAINVEIPYLFCPSTPGGNHRVDQVSATITATISDYAPPVAVAPSLISAGYVPSPGNRFGAIANDRKVRLADILDGTTHTILVIEDGGRPEFWIRGRRGPETNDPGGGNLAVTNGRVLGSGWADPQNSIPLHGFSEDGLTAPGPCPFNCTNNNEAFSFVPAGTHCDHDLRRSDYPRRRRADHRGRMVARRARRGQIPAASHLANHPSAAMLDDILWARLRKAVRCSRWENSDRHALVLDPTNRMLYEFYQMKKTDSGWQAACAAIFDLKSNKS